MTRRRGIVMSAQRARRGLLCDGQGHEMGRGIAGLSLVEVLIAAVLAAVVAAGTAASFIASTRITRRSNATTLSEASGHSVELAENFRNYVGADANCPPGSPCGDFFASKAGLGWQTDQDVVSTGATSGLAVTNQPLQSGSTAWRQYRVERMDCNGDSCVTDGKASCSGTCPAGCSKYPSDDCFSMSVKANWQ